MHSKWNTWLPPWPSAPGQVSPAQGLTQIKIVQCAAPVRVSRVLGVSQGAILPPPGLCTAAIDATVAVIVPCAAPVRVLGVLGDPRGAIVPPLGLL